MALSDRTTPLLRLFRWSTEATVDRTTMLGSGIGVAGPVVLGAAMGSLSAGLTAALGGLMVAGVAPRGPWPAQAAAVTGRLVPAAAASVVAALIARHGVLTDALVALLAGAGAVAGVVSRPLAEPTTRATSYLIIALAVAETTPDRTGLVLLILTGALWAALVSFLLGTMARTETPRDRRSDRGAAPAVSRSPPRASAPLRPPAWQHPLRLTLCLGLAGVLRWLWPDHHLHWVALTVALLTERRIAVLPLRAVQRTLGTALGVLATGVFLALQPSRWGLVLVLGVLASAWPLLRARSPLAYSAVMTPAVVVIMDLGQPLGSGVLMDRLIATAVGAALVIGTNLAFAKALPHPD